MDGKTFWHPFADMSVVPRGGNIEIERGDGSRVFDANGRSYLDATASLWYCNVGHGRTSIADATYAQMKRLESYSTFADFTNRPIEELADRVAAIAPFDDASVFFTSGGSDSVDSAVKLVRRYWHAVGQEDRKVILSRSASYHGMHVAGTSLAGIDLNRAGYGEMLDDVSRVSWDSAAELEKAIEHIGPERVAAFFCEPIVGAGGVFHPPAGYLEEVARICRDSGVLFVADEVVSGYGRAGEWFACQRYGVVPDILTTAKGLTSGYLPMGAMIVAPHVAAPFYNGTVGMWRHGYTYSGHASVAAAALANLAIVEEEGLLARCRAMEVELAAALAPLAKHELISEVRCAEGLLAAVQLAPDVIAAEPSAPARVIAAMREVGVLSRSLATGAVHVSPPLIITKDELGEIAAGIGSALDTVAATL